MRRPLMVVGAVVVVAVVAAVLAGVVSRPALFGTDRPEGSPAPAAAASPLSEVVPLPSEVRPAPGVAFTVGRGSGIVSPAGDAGARAAADLLAGEMRPSTGYPLPVTETASPAPGAASFVLRLVPPDPALGDEGYRLGVDTTGVVLDAASPQGLFHGVQTILQLLPPTIEARTVQPGPWTMAGGSVVDRPRYPYRGAMLDVARFFVPVRGVEDFIEDVSRYKINMVHLHLTDDTGWRLQIDGWPRLATYGGSTQELGGPGGSYTKDQYREIVAFAAARGVTIVPEIDLPGHTAAALASYPELNCDGVAPPLYTGIDVGFSSLCLGRPATDRFVDDVVREVAALTPGPFIDFGGDEANATDPTAYRGFVRSAQGVVQKYGKRPIGWSDSLVGTDPTSSIGQFWPPVTSDPDAQGAAAQGAKFVMSPANRAYVDQKYTPTAPQYGQEWAGHTEARDAYEWDPDTALEGVTGPSVLGVEAPLFTQVAWTQDSWEFLLFPRLPEIAEVGWTPQAQRSFASVASRLGEHSVRWHLRGIDYYRSPQIPWPPEQP